MSAMSLMELQGLGRQKLVQISGFSGLRSRVMDW